MRTKKRKFNMISTIVLVVLFLVGLSVMLYPTISDWWNARTQSYAVSQYQKAVAKMDNSDKENALAQAHAYNTALAALSSPFEQADELSTQGYAYEEILNISGTGIMGYVTIPQINVELPIYHGTSAEVLNIAVGHLTGSSLPVGGDSTHAVISAHRGLPSARLFTDLDQLVVGDIFTITVLDEVFTYEVDQIRIILPNEVDKLAILPGEDRVTLMTCTPYGINSHRLLVQSHRIDTKYVSHAIASADAVRVDPMLVVPVLCVPLLIGLILFWSSGTRRRKRAHIVRKYLSQYEKTHTRQKLWEILPPRASPHKKDSPKSHKKERDKS